MDKQKYYQYYTIIADNFTNIMVWILPDVVVALDVNFVKDPFWRLQEILFHLHSYVPGQQTH